MIAVLNLPATQAVHTADVLGTAAFEYAPALQTAHTLVPLASAENLPAAQAVHTADDPPTVGVLYLPGQHAVQAAEVFAAAKSP